MPSKYERYTANSGYIIPGTAFGSFMNNEEKEKIAVAFYEGKIKSADDMRKYGAGRYERDEDLNDWLKELVDANKAKTGISWNSLGVTTEGIISFPPKNKAPDKNGSVNPEANPGANPEANPKVNPEVNPEANPDYENLLNTAYKDRIGLMTDPNGKAANNYKSTMYDAIERERSSLDETVGSAELSAYRMLGQQQLELENTIAEQRKKALRSGTTSAQLAAQQLQNMFAAQSGAAQVAAGLMNTKIANQQQIGQQRTGVMSGMYDMINSQQTIAATAGAQNMAALGSYASYANSMFNELTGAAKARDILGKDIYNSITKK